MRHAGFSLLILTLLAVGATAAWANGDGPTCGAVSGTIWASSIPRFDEDTLVGFDVVVTDATGPLSGGEVTAALVVTRFMADGSMEFTGEHRFTDTEVGTFVTADHGITTAGGGVADALTIVGDDGGSADGFLVTMGNIDLATGELVLDYHGMVCR